MIFQQELFQIESRGKTEESKKWSSLKSEGTVKSLLELTRVFSLPARCANMSIKLC